MPLRTWTPTSVSSMAVSHLSSLSTSALISESDLSVAIDMSVSLMLDASRIRRDGLICNHHRVKKAAAQQGKIPDRRWRRNATFREVFLWSCQYLVANVP